MPPTFSSLSPQMLNFIYPLKDHTAGHTPRETHAGGFESYCFHTIYKDESRGRVSLGMKLGSKS